jgi:TolB-like protein
MNSTPSGPDIAATAPAKPVPQDGDDAVLLSLDGQFRAMAEEVALVTASASDQVETAAIEQLEATIGRLEPIERAIMAAPTQTLVGLGVKARHAAYVVSEYWDRPVDRIDWDARVMRSLIEAVCRAAGLALPFASDAPLARSEPASAVGEPTSRRLRVGVLPFLAMRSPREERLAFALSQDIAAALARFRWFDVIAPVSLSRKSGAPLMTDDLLKRKQLDYVLDGAVSVGGDQFQISVRLLDLSQDARPVWSDRIKLSIGALHTLDELVTARIVGQLDPIILFTESQPKRRKHCGATGLVLSAMPLMYSMERRKYEQAGNLINRALTIDPDDAMAAAWAAYWQVFHAGQGWAQDNDRAFGIAQQHAVKAMRLDPDNAEALGIYAHVCSFFNKDFDNAVHFFDRALRLNPNLAFIWALSSATYSYIGEPDAALRRLGRYRDLAPFDPYHSWFEVFYAIAYVFKVDYEKGVRIGQRVVSVTPDFTNGYKPLIASLGHLGRREEARRYVDRLLALEPNFTVERFGRAYPIKHEADRERYMMGLRLAGVPER